MYFVLFNIDYIFKRELLWAYCQSHTADRKGNPWARKVCWSYHLTGQLLGLEAQSVTCQAVSRPWNQNWPALSRPGSVWPSAPRWSRQEGSEQMGSRDLPKCFERQGSWWSQLAKLGGWRYSGPSLIGKRNPWGIKQVGSSTWYTSLLGWRSSP